MLNVISKHYLFWVGRLVVVSSSQPLKRPHKIFPYCLRHKKLKPNTFLPGLMASGEALSESENKNGIGGSRIHVLLFKIILIMTYSSKSSAPFFKYIVCTAQFHWAAIEILTHYLQFQIIYLNNQSMGLNDTHNGA